MAAYEMAYSLSSLGWDIHVLTRPLDSPDESFRSRPYSPLTTLPDTLTKDSARLREYLDGFLKDFRPDVIIYHSWADWCREELLDAARDSGIPFFLRSHGAATNFRSFFRFNYPPFFGLKKWLRSFFQIRRNILNVCRKSPLNRLVFLDPYGTLFKSFDYYCASRSKLAHYSCIPNTFPALKRTAPFSGKIRTFLRPRFHLPCRRQHEETAASLHPPCETLPSAAYHFSFSHSPAQCLRGTNGTGHR